MNLKIYFCPSHFFLRGLLWPLFQTWRRPPTVLKWGGVHPKQIPKPHRADWPLVRKCPSPLGVKSLDAGDESFSFSKSTLICRTCKAHVYIALLFLHLCISIPKNHAVMSMMIREPKGSMNDQGADVVVLDVIENFLDINFGICHLYCVCLCLFVCHIYHSYCINLASWWLSELCPHNGSALATRLLAFFTFITQWLSILSLSVEVYIRGSALP